MKNAERVPQALISISLFMAPLLGGQILLKLQPVSEGVGGLLVGIAGPELPHMAHALLVIPILIALSVAISLRKVIQVPHVRLSSLLAVLIGLLLVSPVLSKFVHTTCQASLEWFAAILALFGVVALSGRGNGPRLFLGALVAGCTLLSLRGVIEYRQMNVADWRIFAGWVNGNALAGMLILGLYPALALMLVCRRVTALLFGISSVLILFGIALTQSRGGFIAVGFGLLLFFMLASAWGGVKRASIVMLPVFLAMIMVFGLQAAVSRRGDGANSPLARIANAQATEQQSVGFRKLLWASSLDLIKREPLGTGLGTFRYHSTRPGLVESTHLAHNSFLQFASEVGIVGVTILLLVTGTSIVTGLRNATSLPWESNVLRAGVLAALMASFAHNLVDSDLYHFGALICFFALLGMSLQLSTDGSGPELMPAPLRRLGAIWCGVVAVGLLYFGALNYQKARFLAQVMSSAPSAIQTIDRLQRLSPSDGEVFYMRARYGLSKDPDHFVSDLEQAAKLTPTIRNYLILARTYQDLDRFSSARQTLSSALSWDPNNLTIRLRLLQLEQRAGSVDSALKEAKQLIEVEDTVYFKIRAIPEYVPTETYEARLFIASREKDISRKIEMLSAAVEGYKRYALTTLPNVVRFSKLEPPMDYAGDSLDEAREKMEMAKLAAFELARLYRLSGRTGDAEAAAESSKLFEID